jgi:predicted ArsR family transcriptional regulator
MTWEQIDELRRAAGIVSDALTEPPPDSWTAEEYAQRYGVTVHTARQQLAKLIRAGAVHCGTVKRGRIYQRYYWLAESKQSSGRRR